MKNDVLKTLALKAKNRLIHKTNVDNNFMQDYRIKIIKSGDDVFYDKVKALLEKDVDVINPIKELMDEQLMQGMNSVQKEKYLFQTIEKYQKARSLLEDEKQLKLVY